MQHKAVLEFNLENPDEAKHYQVCLQAGNYVNLLSEIIKRLSEQKDSVAWW